MQELYSIKPALTRADMEDARSLFAQYASTLPVDLGYQNFDAELSTLPGKYAAPSGAIMLARDGASRAAGCIGIRPLDESGACEIKRLFTLPSARGSGLGAALAKAAIGEARRLGDAEVKLDTLPTMHAAIGLYRKLGFEPCERYYAPTPAGTIFMALRLLPANSGGSPVS